MSLAPVRDGCNIELVIIKLVSRIDIFSKTILTEEKWVLVQVMALRYKADDLLSKPMLTQIYVAEVSLGHSELIEWCCFQWTGICLF